MLIGRRQERARLATLVAAAREGRSGALVVRGEAGIGKTALLEHAARAARGTTLLRSRGVESESSLPYGGLVTLAQPLLGLLGELPERQSSALTAALALGSAPPTDQLAVCAATLSLLAAGAERAPVLMLVDDAHWLDPETAQAIGFAARRIANERIAIIVAIRDDESSAFATDGLEELVLAGLEVDDATRLLGGRVDALVAQRLQDVTTGNPLALIELVETLTDGQRLGLEPVAEPMTVGDALEHAFSRRLARLTGPARAAVLLAAAAGERDDVETLRHAWDALGITVTDVADAERMGVITIESGRVAFRHPLVRAAAYASGPDPDRRAAHAALAAVLDTETQADEHAWHVALAAVGPDEPAAATIEAAGRRAEGRSRHTALRALSRAAALTPAGEARPRRYLAAAQAAADAGAYEEASTLLEHPSAADATGDLVAERLYLLGIVADRRGLRGVAAELLEQAAAMLARVSPSRAAVAEVQASQAWLGALERQRAIAACERAASLPFERGGKTELTVLLCQGDMAGWTERLDEAAAFWRRAAELVDQDDPDQLQMAGEALFSAGDDDGALRLLRRAEKLARERAALGTLTVALMVRGLTELRAGDLQAAHAAADECVTLMRAIGQRGEQAVALGLLAWVEAMLGRDGECRAHVDEAHAVLRETGVGAPFGGSGVGLLELSLGHVEAAVEALETIMSARADRLDTEVIAPRPILPTFIEALARAGENERAADLLGDRLDVARRTGRPHAIAPLLRCHGVLYGDESAFREALEYHARWPNRWERARTELCYGELLRRAKRRADARVALRAAIAGFEDSGAVIWEERARVELRATGERARRRDPSTVDDLTPQELHVARLVATGLTNREVAAQLFLSPKTIETHLSHVFRKTGVRTRAELAYRFRDPPDSNAPLAP